MNSTLRTIVKLYVNSACRYGEAMDNGNFELASSFFEENEYACMQMLKHGPPGTEALVKMLDHGNSHVRLSAATNLLNTCQDQALAVLKVLAGKQGFIGFHARMILEDWEKDDLVVPRFDRESCSSAENI